MTEKMDPSEAMVLQTHSLSGRWFRRLRGTFSALKKWGPRKGPGNVHTISADCDVIGSLTHTYGTAM